MYTIACICIQTQGVSSVFHAIGFFIALTVYTGRGGDAWRMLMLLLGYTYTYAHTYTHIHTYTHTHGMSRVFPLYLK